MLKSLTIDRYRGIRTGTIGDFGAVNLLVGRNGSGKSTVLEAIYTVAVRYGADAGPLQRRRGVSGDRSFYGRDSSHPLMVTCQLDGMVVMYTDDQGRSNRRPVVDTEASQLGAERQAFFRRMKLLDTRDLLAPDVERETYSAVVNQRKDRELVKVINEVYGLSVESLTYVPDQGALVLRVLFKDRDFALDIDDLGAGVRIALRLLLIMSLAGGSAVLVEEFDAYQHVDALDRLAEALLELAARQRIQVFLTTHSLETVQRFAAADRKLGKSLLRVFQTQLAPDGAFASAGVKSDDAARLIEAGVDLRRT